MRRILAVNMNGPDGERLEAGSPVPTTWPAEYVEDLMRTQGVVEVEDVDNVEEIPQ